MSRPDDKFLKIKVQLKKKKSRNLIGWSSCFLKGEIPYISFHTFVCKSASRTFNKLVADGGTLRRKKHNTSKRNCWLLPPLPMLQLCKVTIKPLLVQMYVGRITFTITNATRKPHGCFQCAFRCPAWTQAVVAFKKGEAVSSKAATQDLHLGSWVSLNIKCDSRGGCMIPLSPTGGLARGTWDMRHG